MIHPLADVKSRRIGTDTNIWQYAVVLSEAQIGKNCNINCHTFIENKVIIGDNVTVKSGVYLWDGITVEDDVFIGPNVTFTNDKFPRSKQYPEEYDNIYIEKGASVGAGAIILGGVRIGRYALIAAGAIVTKNVPEHALVKGSPARVCHYVDEFGNKLISTEDYFLSISGNKYFFPPII
jgi:UDP-2-acetamido-3-amino-2,3-dideoxy-glucuronate N-acetyltransferase